MKEIDIKEHTPENILNKHIKGDLKRDYKKADREYFTIYIQTALNCMRKYARPFIAQNAQLKAENINLKNKLAQYEHE